METETGPIIPVLKMLMRPNIMGHVSLIGAGSSVVHEVLGDAE